MTERYTARDGDYLEPDGWPRGEKISVDTDTFRDAGWPGCAFRVPCRDFSLGINITVTGRPHYRSVHRDLNYYRSRCRIEFVGDCEPSTFAGGWIYHCLNN